MKHIASLILLLGFAAFAVASSFSLNSCRNTTSPTDTVYVNHPSGNSAWTIQQSGTSSDLVIGQFQNSTTGFVAGQNGTILKTNDGGNTWSVQSPVPIVNTSNGPGVVYGLSFAGSSLLAVGDQRVIAQSNNAGASWSAMNSNDLPQTDLVRSVSFVNSTTGFAGTSDAYAAPSGSICKTVDGGQTWEPVFTTNGGIYSIAFNGMNGVAQGRYGVSYWTSDGGASWNPGTTDVPNDVIGHMTFTSATNGFAVGQQNPSLSHILQTTDAGHTWTTIKTVALGLQGIASNGNGTITTVGYNGAIVESTDGGMTWQQSTAGTNRLIDIKYISATRAIIIGASGTIMTRGN